MKILHTADWHLGKRLDHTSRLEEQRQVLEEICLIAEEQAVDAVLIAGDLFDTVNPSIEAIELFYHTLKRLTAEGTRLVVGIAGNHDSPDRIEAPTPLARECGIILLGYPDTVVKPFSLDSGLKVLRNDQAFVELALPNTETPLRLILTPYANENRLRKSLGEGDKEAELRKLLQQRWQTLADTYCDDQGINLLMTHLFVCKQGDEQEGLEDEDEKSVLTIGGAQAVYTHNFPAQLDYVALGHLHAFIPVQEKPFPIVYSSSPLCYSLNDRSKEKYVILIEAELKQPVQIKRIPLTSGKKTVQATFDSIDNALIWLTENPNTLVECTIVTEEHLTAQDRKRLYDAHRGIVRIIPKFSNPDYLKFTSGKQVDLSKTVPELFEDYFLHKNSTKPNAEIMDLLQEVLSEEATE